ncbi:hypothetical protein BDP27DRAFT_1310277 [Rhodocollybia butyracea]|uniref:Methyltransferase domain-containing protein n=1 Tax=Rhodocollybia butyracea TaxID=206335 RepID=A0A9P5QC52_9AGAR|nr:hypothetical protein BDP27DRAFT_1310277 [Rhodocollybia butyracea]
MSSESSSALLPSQLTSRQSTVKANYQDIDHEDLALLHSLTGIKDEKELEGHINAVQKKANQIHAYPCIGLMSFTKFNIKLFPHYERVISIPKTRNDAIFLDVGCCVGNSLRKAVSDGWPVEQTVGTDLHTEFWDIGHELFRSTPDSFPAGFVGGDLFNDDILAQPNANTIISHTKDLRSLTSLTPLRGGVAAIYVCNFFHLFNSEKQLELARRLASLLTQSPGSVIFGSHGVTPSSNPGSANPASFHSAESFASMWTDVFEANTVEVFWEVKSRPKQRFSPLGRWDIIWWSVTRL